MNKSQVARFSRQIILKNIGALGQKKIIKSKVLIIGMGGLGCSVAEFLTRAGVGNLGIIDFDNVDITNIHRQSLYDVKDIKKSKVIVAKKKLRKINSNTKFNCYKVKLNEGNIKNIISKYDYIIDGSDNFKTKFLVNDYCKKTKKFLVVGAISKFDGHIFTFNFKNKNTPCIRSFFQEKEISEDILNCDWMKKMRGGDDAEELEQFKLPPSTVMTRKTSSSYKSDDFNEDISIEAKRMSSLTITKMKESGISAKRESTMQRGKNDEVTVRRKSTSSPRTGKKSMTKKKKKKKLTFEEREEDENDGGGAGIEGYRRASRTFQTPPSSPLKEE